MFTRTDDGHFCASGVVIGEESDSVCVCVASPQDSESTLMSECECVCECVTVAYWDPCQSWCLQLSQEMRRFKALLTQNVKFQFSFHLLHRGLYPLSAHCISHKSDNNIFFIVSEWF